MNQARAADASGDMKRPVPLSINNASDATETDAPELSKKPRPCHTPSSGAADQEPGDAPEKIDVDTTRDAPPMEVVEEEKKPDDEEVPEEATEEDKWAAAGWISPKGVADDAVAAAKAAATAQCDDKMTKLLAALSECGEEGAPDSLEMIPAAKLTKKRITNIIDIKDVDGASYSGLFDRGERQSVVKAQGRVRSKLEELISDATASRSNEIARAELDARVDLEYAAVEALSEDTPDVTIRVATSECTRFTCSHIGHQMAVVGGVRYAHGRRGSGMSDGGAGRERRSS